MNNKTVNTNGAAAVSSVGNSGSTRATIHNDRSLVKPFVTVLVYIMPPT